MKLKSILCSLLTMPVTVLGAGGTYCITDFGAVADATTDNSVAIQAALRACSDDGGGTVVVPAGKTFMTGPVELLSNVNLRLEPNSRLLANPDEGVYRLSAFGANEGEGMMWLHANGATHLSISGTGTLDGNGIAFMAEEAEDSYNLKPTNLFDPRPHLLTLENVSDLNIRDITVANSAYWTIHLVGCQRVLIDGVTILNPLKIRNCDGIDVDHSKNVRIANCHIESGDDSICLKNRREYDRYGDCHDIVVENCTMTSRSCAIKIGSENVNAINRVLFNNCIVKDSNRGVGIQNRDEGTVSDVVFSNMIIDCHFFSDVWWGKAEPIYVTSYPRRASRHKDGNWRFPKGATSGSCGQVSRIWFTNILCTSENGIFVGGDVPGKVRDIVFRDVDLQLRKVTDYPGMIYDRRPCLQEEMFSDKTYGFYLECADDIRITDCTFGYSADMAERIGGFIKEVDTRGVKLSNNSYEQ